MAINFQIKENLVNELTWEEYEVFESAQEGDVKIKTLRPIMARFMVDDNNKHLAHAVAMKQLGAIPLSQIRDVMKAFSDTLVNAAVPKANGNLSNSLSAAVTPASEFPDGSQP